MNDKQMAGHIKDSPEYKEYTKKCLHNKLPIDVLLNRHKFAEWKCPCIKYERPMECVNDIRSNAQKVVRALQTTLRRFLNWKLETRSTRGSIEKVLTEDEIESVREFIRMLDSEKTVLEACTCDSKEYSGLNNYEGEPYKAATPKCAGMYDDDKCEKCGIERIYDKYMSKKLIEALNEWSIKKNENGMIRYTQFVKVKETTRGGEKRTPIKEVNNISTFEVSD